MLYSVHWSLVDLGSLEKGSIIFRAGNFSWGIPASMAGTTLCRSHRAHVDKKKKFISRWREAGCLLSKSCHSILIVSPYFTLCLLPPLCREKAGNHVRGNAR